jgi:hypothetical protein
LRFSKFRSSTLTRQAGSILIPEQKPNGRLFTLYEGSVEFPINPQHIADTLGLSLVPTNKTLLL